MKQAISAKLQSYCLTAVT